MHHWTQGWGRAAGSLKGRGLGSREPAAATGSREGSCSSQAEISRGEGQMEATEPDSMQFSVELETSR